MDVDDRLRELELTMAGVQQRVADHENDYRVFAPMVTDQALLRASVAQIEKDVGGAHKAIREVSERLDQEHEERVKGQQARREELATAIEARDKELRTRDEKREEMDAMLKSRMKIAIVTQLGLFGVALVGLVAALITGAHP